MKEIVEELLDVIKQIPHRERQGKWFEEYLDKVNTDLKLKNRKKINETDIVNETHINLFTKRS